MTPAEKKEKVERGAAVLEAMSLLRRLGAATNEWQRSTVDEGFTVNQALVLHHLVKHGDATPSQLADWMHITRGSVTPTVNRLEDLGLVTRRIDEYDGRKQWLSATPEAQEVAPEVEEKVLKPALAELGSWPLQDLREFNAKVEQLLESSTFGGRA